MLVSAGSFLRPSIFLRKGFDPRSSLVRDVKLARQSRSSMPSHSCPLSKIRLVTAVGSGSSLSVSSSPWLEMIIVFMVV